jgi:transposase
MTELVCKKCSSSNYVKSGHIRGHQRFRCKDCSCQFTGTKPRGVHPALKCFAIVLYGFCGVSMGNIGRLFKVSTVAVLKWVRAAAAHIDPPCSTQSPEVVMVDEFWHFIDGKKTKSGCGEPLMGYRVNLSDGNWAIVLMPALRSLSIALTPENVTL